MKEALPIGSIVKMKTKEPDELMVIGYFPIDEATSSAYDYVGVLTPCGAIGTDSLYLFNEKDIENILFRGFLNSENENLLIDIPEGMDTIKRLMHKIGERQEEQLNHKNIAEIGQKNENQTGNQTDTGLDLKME